MKEKNMRQAGLKPKNHNNGVYWVRASSGNNGTSTTQQNDDLGAFGLLVFLMGLPIVLTAALVYRIVRLFNRG